MDYPSLTNVPEIHSFIGLVGYYYKFIKDFSRIAYPITQIQQKGKKFIWNDKCELTFSTLK